MRLIDADALIEKLKSNFDNGDVYTDKDQFIIDCIHLLDNAPTVDKYIHIDDVYRLIAGHSDYHGDNILSAFTCLAEGKEVRPIKPIDIDNAPTVKLDINDIEYQAYCRGLEEGKKIARPPRGKWVQTEIIDDDAEYGVNDDASECSNCKHIESSHYWTTTYFNYCPNCGADMRSVE